jgi:hypothetical protein
MSLKASALGDARFILDLPQPSFGRLNLNTIAVSFDALA